MPSVEAVLPCTREGSSLHPFQRAPLVLAATTALPRLLGAPGGGGRLRRWDPHAGPGAWLTTAPFVG